MHQATSYAQDYAKNSAYLVVINLAGQPLEFAAPAEAKTWPPYIDVGEVRVFLISIRALPTVTASKLGKAKPTVITIDDLTNPGLSD